MAVSEYDKKNLSQKQQDRIAEVTAQAQSGKMTWADAHKEAENIRNNAGYSGGRYGNEYNSNKGNGGSSGSGGNGSSGGTPYVKGPGYGTGGYTTNGAYGVPVLEPTDMAGYWKKMTGGADMSRRPDLAGGYAISNGYTVYYDKDGYATKASKGTIDYAPHQDINVGNGSYGKNGAWTDREMMGDKQGSDFWKIQEIRDRLQRGEITGDQANQAANAIRAGYGYTIDKNGYVTDSGALSAVNDRRKQLGLSTDPENAELGYYRYLMGTDTSPLAQAAGQVKSYEDFMKDYTPGQQIPYPTVGNMDILQGLVSNGFNTSDAGRPSFDYSYDSEMRALIDQILNSNLADWKQGDQYAALRDQYAANGEMGMADLLGQVSSRTGGLASSYAASVANQEYNDWMSKLEQAAREMYQQDRSDKLNSLGVLSDAYDREYGEYGDKLNQWNTDRNFAYQQAQDALANQWKQKEWDYNMSQDEWNKAAQQAEMMASYGDFSGYKALGYTDSQIESMRQAYQIAQTAKAKSGSSGGKKSGDSGNDRSPVTEDYDGLMLAAEQSGHPESYIANHYKEYGFNKSTGLAGEYETWKSGQDSSAFNGSYFNAAMSSLRTMLNQGGDDRLANAEQGVSSMWNKLNARQKAEVQKLLAEYGIAYEGD